VERRFERFAGFRTSALADDAALSQIALGEVYELVLRDPQDPDVPVGRDDHTLHEPECRRR